MTINYMLVKCLRSKIYARNQSVQKCSAEIEFKADGFWDIKSMQQIMVESINQWLLNLLCKLLWKSLWPPEKESLFVHPKCILVSQVLLPRREPNSANISGNFS